MAQQEQIIFTVVVKGENNESVRGNEMNMREKIERLKSSPKWFQEVVSGLDKSYQYSVYLTGKQYAIIKCDGYSWFTNAIAGMKYEPVHYLLVEKGKNYWVGFHSTLWEGRLTDTAIARMKTLLKDFNRTDLSRVEKVRLRTALREKAIRRESINEKQSC